MNDQDEQTTQEAPGRRDVLRRVCVATVVVAGAISTVVCAALISNCVRLRLADPLEAKELAVLKARLVDQPDNDRIKREIRELDLAVRSEHFLRRRRFETGAYLLAAALGVLLVSLQLAAWFGRAGPQPPGAPPGAGYQTRSASAGRWSVVAMILVIAGGATTVVLTRPRGLTRDALIRAEPAETKPEPATIRPKLTGRWPRFRGPGGLGFSTGADMPTSFDVTTRRGLLWKARVPIDGKSSPIVWGDRVFLTGATASRREVYCFDAVTGELLWARPVAPGERFDPDAPEPMEDTGYAAPSAVTDGKRLCTIFATGHFACFDFAGERLWRKGLETPDNQYGHAASLAMHKNVLLIQFDQGNEEDEKSVILGVDIVSGEELWKTPRPVGMSWTSPIVIETKSGPQVIACSNPWVVAYNPMDGKEIWRVKCLEGDGGPSPIFVNGLVLAVNEDSMIAAIRPDGHGDVTATHIAWTHRENLPNTCSPVSNGKLVFILTTQGTLTCLDAADGKEVWRKDFETSFYSSPAIAAGRLYLMSRNGRMTVLEASREYKLLGTSNLGEPSDACFAFADGRIYIRGEDHLFCIGAAEGATSK